MTVSRRTLLATTAATAVVGALGTAYTERAVAATPTDAEFETLRERWVDLATGRNLVVPSDPDFQRATATADRAVTTALGLVQPGADRYFSDQKFTDDVQLRASYVRFQQMATAYVTPGSRYQGSSALLDATLAGVRHAGAIAYHPGRTEYGNWWNWEIGITRSLATVMAILAPQMTEADIAAGCAAIDYYVPDPWQQYPVERPGGRIASDGANRVDLCQAVIVRSIVGHDGPRLQHAIAGLSDTWQIVSSGNGFYADGSFLQHSTIGYSGTYGLVLLNGLSLLFALVAGSPADITDPTRVTITRSVEDSFAPFMYDGQMIDAVRGRAVSRETERSIDDGNIFIEATLRLAQAVDATTAARWRGLCLGWIQRNSAATILTTTSIPRLALVKDLLASDTVAIPEGTGARLFPAMDRLVYRGADWASCVAMCSNRIAWYECGNGENNLGYQTSQGMTYLYLPTDDGHFDDNFWATSDLWAPVGTTVDTTPLPPKVEGEWGAVTPKNEWTGGTVFEDVALVGQHLIGPGGTGLTARKTWFFTPEMYVALGSDLRTGSAGSVVTTVEHRNLGTVPRQLLVDGSATTSRTGVARWAHLEGVGGYVLLDAPSVTADVAPRTGSWRRNRTASPDTTITCQYATLRITGGATYAYAVIPNAGPDRTAALARTRCSSTPRRRRR